MSLHYVTFRDIAFRPTGHPLDYIPLVTVAEVVTILEYIPGKSSVMDFIATSVIQSRHGISSEPISKHTNLSFNEG